MSTIKKPTDLILAKAKKFHLNGDFDAEEACYSRLKNTYSLNLLVLEKIYLFQEGIESWNSALETLLLLKKLHCSSFILNRQAVVLRKLNRNNESIEISKLSLKENDAGKFSYSLLVETYSLSPSSLDDGINFFTNNLKSNESIFFNYYSLATLHYNKIIRSAERDYNIPLQFLKICDEDTPNNSDVLNFLGVIYFEKKELTSAIDCFLKAIQINPNDSFAHTNLGVLFSYDLLTDDPSGDTLSDPALSGGFKDNISKAVYHLDRAISIEPKSFKAIENLAAIYFRSKAFDAAISLYNTLPGWEGKEGLIKSYYAIKDYNKFSTLVDNCSSLSEFNNSRVISGILSHSDIHINKQAKSYFCPQPFDYIECVDNPDIDGLPDFNQRLLSECDSYDLGVRNQILITNGLQSSRNIFSLSSPLLDVFSTFLLSAAEEYRSKFHNSEACLIKNWPNNFYISGWIVKMTEGGYLNPHNHINGWLSGVYYIQVPKKNNSKEGDIKFSLGEKTPDAMYPKSTSVFPEKEVTTLDSRLILFPSSLYHQTNSFSDNSPRICIAFDLQPV